MGLLAVLSFTSLQNGKGLLGCPWAVQMEAGDKTGFAVQSETEAVFLTLYLPYASTGVPLVNAEIGRRNALYRNLLGQRRTSC